MRIRDTSTVYSYSISVCMGSFVFGYEVSSFGNLSDLISAFNFFPSDAERDQSLLLLSSIFALSAIFGISPLIQVSSSIDSSSRPSGGSSPSNSPTTSPSSPHSSASSASPSARNASPEYCSDLSLASTPSSSPPTSPQSYLAPWEDPPARSISYS